MAEYDENSLPSPIVSDYVEKRTRTFTHKDFQNTLVNQTKTFNKRTKALQVAIDLVYKTIEENSKIEEALNLLQEEKRVFETTVKSLKDLFVQDQWNEATDVEPTIRKTFESFSQAVEFVTQQAETKLKRNESREWSSVGSRQTKSSRQTGSSRPSLHSERRGQCRKLLLQKNKRSTTS